MALVERYGLTVVLPEGDLVDLQEPRRSLPSTGQRLTIDFVSAPPTDAVGYLQRVSGQPIRLEEGPPGEINTVMFRSVPLDDARYAILLALNVAGYTWTETDSGLHIRPR